MLGYKRVGEALLSPPETPQEQTPKYNKNVREMVSFITEVAHTDD